MSYNAGQPLKYLLYIYFSPDIEEFMFKKADIKKLRQRLGLSQEEFAEELGVRQPTISRLENGDMTPSGPVAKVLERLTQESPA